MERSPTRKLLRRNRFGDTDRTDRWWLRPLAIFVGLSIFIVYATFRTFYPVFSDANPGISSGPLLSPFFAPLIFGEAKHAWFGAFPEGWPTWLRSPALLILWAPLGFRLTCYYARKAYYRGFFTDPAACAVSEGNEEYTGETGFWIFQNLHRYFLYLALIFMVILWYDAIKAMFGWDDAVFKVTGGTVVLTLDALLITGYTLGCHSFRYLVGGKKRCFTCPRSGGDVSGRYHLWQAVTKFNNQHNLFFWSSLFMVGFTDLYVWMVATGTWKDIVLIG